MHTQTVATRFLTRSSSRAEKSVAILRLAVAAAAWLRVVAIYGWEPYARFDPKIWVVTTGLAVGALGSLGILAHLRTGKLVSWQRGASIALDFTVIAATLIPATVWPASDYLGVLRSPDVAVILLGLIVAGFRMSMRMVGLATALALALCTALIALDLAGNSALLAYDFDEYAIAGIYLMASVGLAVAVVWRTRQLVEEGSAATAESERTRQRLGAYVSAELTSRLLEGEQVDLEGRRQDVAVLFSDLRGFTTYAEPLTPERLVEELNEYLDAMVTVIREEGGVVDKYIGDAIMVVFGVPHSRPDDAARALRTAARMQSALVVLNMARARRGLPPLNQGIGIHYGPTVAGNIGTPERLQYTVVGDTVNVASRVESMTKQLDVGVLITQETVEAAAGHDHPAVTLHGAVPLRGRDGTLNVYTLEGDAASG